MTATLAIGRLATRIRAADPDRVAALTGQVRAVLGGRLRQDLDGIAGRALARAGLPASAVVAVRRLSLRLRVGVAVDSARLSQGWADACEQALAQSLSGVPAGADVEAADQVWFPDPWAAERRYLELAAAGVSPAWWVSALVDAGADTPRPAVILQRWLALDPPRAVITMTALAAADQRVTRLLGQPEAADLTRALVVRLSAAAPGLPDGEGAPTDDGGAVRARAAFLREGLGRLRGLAESLTVAAGGADAAGLSRAAPWLAAALFARYPAVCRLSPTLILDLIARTLVQWAGSPAVGPTLPAAAAADSHPGARRPAVAGRPDQGTGGAVAAESFPDSGRVFGAADEGSTDGTPGLPIHAGGLLLLIRPLLKLGLLPDAPHLASRLGDLALTALRRVLAPLPPGELAAAQERERPLLAVFAPECDWGARIAAIPVRDPTAAADLLAALSAVIPAETAFAPGASRRIFGSSTPAIGTAADLLLARLLLRPGRLRVTDWEAELTWPLAAADLALRRAGWDQDPGWVPWLGRTLRLRFGESG
ncbi:hypothetical protein [uncultured Lamprocystis sp.]|jgi:hypothetical protein|uniref:hypothetical protein n=1 Tax=uncultured Lamprocystis sp. TaxID=543132 RepID=UPI0025E457AE|nr:hypothetical protein [uncultured Lamprocystis sp.]